MQRCKRSGEFNRGLRTCPLRPRAQGITDFFNHPVQYLLYTINHIMFCLLAGDEGEASWPFFPKIEVPGICGWAQLRPRESSHGVLALVVHDGAWK